MYILICSTKVTTTNKKSKPALRGDGLIT